MNNNITTYTSQPIDPSILSVLDIVDSGKVVSAEDWVTLWNLVIGRINSIDAYCVAIEDIRINWKESEAQLQQIIANFTEKYDAFSDCFIHYGTDAPTNPETKFWVEPVEAFLDDMLVRGVDLKKVQQLLQTSIDTKQGRLKPGSGINLDSDNNISVPVDQTYNPESKNAQSGKAVAEATKNIKDKANKSEVPELFVGTEIFGGHNGTELSFAESGGVYLKYKVGDLYFNTNEQRCYQCTDVEFTEGMIAGSPYNKLYHSWIGLNYRPDTSYNPKSWDAQSGLAVAEAVAGKQDKFADTLTEEKDGCNGFVINKPVATIRAGQGGLTLEGYTLALNSTESDYIYCSNKTLRYVGDPTEENEAATKGYVDKEIKKVDGGSGGNVAVDQIYNPESENAQSGLAVAEAIKYKADAEKVEYSGSLPTDLLPDEFAPHKGDWIVLSVSKVDETGRFILTYGINSDNGYVGKGEILISNNIITPDKVSRGTRININGDGHWVIITVIKDVANKADKSLIGDIGTALDQIIALQESIMGGE